MIRSIPTLIAVLMVALAWPAPASAQSIRRCVDAEGNSLFTDRPCSVMNAVPKQAPPEAVGNFAGQDSAGGFRGGFSDQGGSSPRGCARRPEELLDRVRSALESRDVNRLASHYHWTGTGSGSGKQLMDTLERIAAQALLSVELVYPDAPPELPAQPQDPYAVGPFVPNPYHPPAATAAAPPRHIRVLQMRSDQAEQATSTTFQLRRNAGCWWIEL
jgi:hypothetical protein